MDNDEDFLLDDEDFLPEDSPEENNTVLESTNDSQIIPDTSEHNNTIPIEDILNNQVDIENDNEQINDEYESEKIKTFIYSNAKILPVIAFLFVSVLGVYIFINNVKADMKNLIKIEENQKVGYINDTGNVIVKPKYLYGTDFYNGYAIVKNYNNLYGIIDGKGNNEISFGNIFSANLYGNKYIVSKFTNEGLKMGILDSNLKEVTRFKYDNLSYLKDGIFIYTYNDTMGIMNSDGKEIYAYKVDEVDDKNISIEVSNLTDKSSSDIYARVKVNASSTIINTRTGNEVYKYTLEDIKVLDNNVFYIKNDNENNKYFVIKDDKIVFETSSYKRLRVEDLSSNIAIAIRDDAKIDYINLLDKQKINQEGSVKYTYSDSVILKQIYNFQTSKEEYTIFTPKKVLGTFENIKPVDDTYVNGFMKIYTDNNKYGFINKQGEVITKNNYDKVNDFDKSGYAIVSNDNTYGIINSSGKEVVPLKYDEIKFLDSKLFSNVEKMTSEELFIYRDNNSYGIINSQGKILAKAVYDNFKTVTTKYPIIKVKYNNENMLLNLRTFKELPIDSSDIQIYDDYILSGDDYYNYDGELIYTIGG